MKLFTINFLLILFLIPSFSHSRNKKDVKKAFSVHIFSSSNITGNIEPCG